MLVKEAKLNPKVFNKDVEQQPTRNGYGEGLIIAGEKNEDVVVLCADLTESTRSQAFSEKFPERFFEMGVAEQNMAAVAAGLGVSGKIPFVSSYATFSPGRNWEQIRTTICYNDSNVKIAGSHTGVSVGPDGATHQATEDIATMRVLPNMRVFVPCDAIEARKATVAAAKIWGPCYLRYAREKSPIITTEKTPYVPGKAEIFWQSKKSDIAIIGCGPLLYNCLVAARDLDKENIGTIVVNCHTIKPLDEHTILDVVRRCKGVVVVEEHQVVGGLGGAIAELLAQKHPMPMRFIGLHNTFGESGQPNEVIEKYEMGVTSVIQVIKKFKL